VCSNRKLMREALGAASWANICLPETWRRPETIITPSPLALALACLMFIGTQGNERRGRYSYFPVTAKCPTLRQRRMQANDLSRCTTLNRLRPGRRKPTAAGWPDALCMADKHRLAISCIGRWSTNTASSTRRRHRPSHSRSRCRCAQAPWLGIQFSRRSFSKGQPPYPRPLPGCLLVPLRSPSSGLLHPASSTQTSSPDRVRPSSSNLVRYRIGNQGICSPRY